MLHLQHRTNDPANDSSWTKRPSLPSANLTDSPPASPRSPYLSSSRPFSSSPPPVFSDKFDSSPRPSSIASSSLEDVLLPGDIVGQGASLQGELIRRVSLGTSPRSSLDIGDDPHPATEFQVIRRLGTGSYAVVYLVREIISRAPSDTSSDESGVLGSMELDGSPSHSRHNSVIYGREYAIKCLSKANLDEEQLSAQMSEVKIHQSLHSHPNIVTLHRTFETSSFLLLLLEFVPGEDLFYFLEQARDHYDPPSEDADESVSSVSSNTPPTPSLLSTLHPSQLLSRTRLRLVASMFNQMCDAVAACHAQRVYHRDIKPENFIVTDGYVTRSDGFRERKVFVKLTDFGLSTTDQESGDMDCGSAPYMSYECRNNVAPAYLTDAADVWSLGIVLINMLYHHNPWTDTAQGACTSFDLFRYNPVQFFLSRFGGMTRPVAEYLANNVFCILEDGDGPTPAVRVSASEFGQWARDLPDLLAMPPVDTAAFHRRHQRVVSTTSTIEHPVSPSTQISHRPCSRHPSGSTGVNRTPAIPSRSLSRAPSMADIGFDRKEPCELSTVIDQDVEESEENHALQEEEEPAGQDGEIQEVEFEEAASRSSSHRRRKRGRKGKGGASISTPATPADETLDVLANASQSLAREISRQSRASSRHSSTSKASSRRSKHREGPVEPPPFFPVPTAMLSSNPLAPPPLPVLATSMSRPARAPPRSPATKKPSKWKLSIGKSKGTATAPASPDKEVQQPPSPLTPPSAFAIKTPETGPPPMSVAVSNVTNILNGLNAPPPTPSAQSLKAAPNGDGTWPRGRRSRGSPGPPSRSPASSQSRSRPRQGPLAFGITDVPVPPLPIHAQPALVMAASAPENWSAFENELARSPHSTRSSASSNWRSSTSTTSSAYTSTSAFTRYSNSSSRSVSTAATSVSGHSWRKDSGSISSNNSRYHAQYPNVPRNIKIMNGVPSELAQVPRGQHPSLDSELYGTAPPRKQRTRKPKDLQLDTITERPIGSSPGARSSGQKSPTLQRMPDASISDPDLTGDGKAHKGQINALAKMLSALRR